MQSHYEGIKAWETSQSRLGRNSGTVPAISEYDLGQLNIEGVFMNPSFIARGKFSLINGVNGNQDSSKYLDNFRPKWGFRLKMGFISRLHTLMNGIV